MRVIGPGPGRGTPLYSECREGCRVKIWPRGGEVGTGKRKILCAELGRRKKNQLGPCRKEGRASTGTRLCSLRPSGLILYISQSVLLTASWELRFLENRDTRASSSEEFL